MEKKLASEVERIQADYSAATVKIWAEDEHRLGLNPVTRQVCVEAGDVPNAQVNWKRQWLWLYPTFRTLL